MPPDLFKSIEHLSLTVGSLNHLSTETLQTFAYFSPSNVKLASYSYIIVNLISLFIFVGQAKQDI